MSLLTNLTSYYKLQGNSTDSAGSFNGTDTSITYSTGNGKIGQGAGFNGATPSYILNATGQTIATNESMAFWFKSTSLGSYSHPYVVNLFNGAVAFTAIQFSTSWAFQVSDSNSVNFFIQTASGYNDGNWHHFVGVKSGNNGTLYIDGHSQGTGSASFTGTFTGAVLSIGTQQNHIDQFYTGALDEIGFWSRALSASEVNQLYNFNNGLPYPLNFAFDSFN